MEWGLAWRSLDAELIRDLDISTTRFIYWFIFCDRIYGARSLKGRCRVHSIFALHHTLFTFNRYWLSIGLRTVFLDLGISKICSFFVRLYAYSTNICGGISIVFKIEGATNVISQIHLPTVTQCGFISNIFAELSFFAQRFFHQTKIRAGN